MIIDNKEHEYHIRRLTDIKGRITDEIKELERKIYVRKEEISALETALGRLNETTK